MRDETIEIREGDYVVAMSVASGPAVAASPPVARFAGLGPRVAAAFLLGFGATALVWLAATLL